MPYIDQQQLDYLTNQARNHQKAIDDLKNLMKNHQHSGFDGSKTIESSITLPGSSYIKLGDSVDFGTGIAPTPAYLNIGGGQSVESKSRFQLTGGVVYTSINIADQQDLKTATRWGGIAFGETGKDTASETRQMVFGIDKFDVSKKEIYSKFLKELVQVNLVGRSLALGSFFGGFSGSFDYGTGTITSAGHTLTDATKSWDVNMFAEIATTPPYDAVVVAYSTTLSPAQYDIRMVLTNTANTLTIDAPWSFTDTVRYNVFFPILLGATFMPWRAARFSYNSKIQCIGSGSTGLLLENLANYTGAVSGDERVVKIIIDSNPYYFKVYGTLT